MSVLLESLVRDKSGETEVPLSIMAVSFAAVGIGAAIAYGVMSSVLIGMHTGMPDWMASALAYTIFMSAAYALHRRFSFRSNAPHSQAFPRYALTQATGLALAGLFSYVAYSVMGLHTAFAGVLVFALTSMVNFVVVRSWAFR